MTIEDPWGSAPADEPQLQPETAPVQQAPIATTTVAVKPVIVGDAGKITLTFKGGGAYADRWLVAHVANPAEGLELLKDPQFKELLDLSKRIASYDSGGSAPAGGGNQQSQAQQPAQQSNVPQGATQAPGGEERFCSHGKMEFKSGVSKAGKPYKLFGCTAPRDSQCKAVFL